MLNGSFMIQEKPTPSSSRGEVGQLQNPLAVLLHNECADPVSFDMVAIVKQTLVFSKRPVPIVGAPAVPSSGDGNEVAAKRRKIG